jgi:accessory gene regulator protein AgrB
MGIMGLSAVLLVTIFGGIINGPVLAAIFTIVGFSAFGKHLKNSAPVVIGVIVAALYLGLDLSSTGIIISILFSTTIAPIAGKHGPIIGFIAGVLHLAVVTNIGIVHGGINLYNNGFSGGLVAGFLIPIVDAFKKGD